MRLLPLSHVPIIETRAALLSLVVAGVLTAIKFVAYFMTGSAVIFSDAMENIVNVAAAAFALYSLYYAHLPADASHPYGHGKIEFVSAGFEGGMILLAAVIAAVQGINGLIHHSSLPPGRLDLALLLMAIALITNGATGFFLVRTGRRQGSLTLIADGKHLLADASTSIAAIAALLILKATGWTWVDPVGALLVAAYIARTGIQLVRHALSGLLDEQDALDATMLRGILDEHVSGKDPVICGYHKLRHRHSGRYHWVDFHIQVPGNLDIHRGHAIASAIEFEMQNALGEGNATAHVEPCDASKCGKCGDNSEKTAEIR